MQTKITKPAPPPPTKGGHKSVRPRAERVQTFKQLSRYHLPMRAEYEPEWRAMLKDARYPTPVVVLDFETYFDTEYSMGGNKLSTIEYIMDDRFEILGASVLEVTQPFPDYENQSWWHSKAEGFERLLAHLKCEYGENLERCTVVAQNAQFDGAILSFRYGIVPPYFIDVLGLARHWNSRTKNDLDTLSKRYDLPAKGDTKKFKEWTHRRRMKRTKGRKKGPKKPQQLPRMTDVQEAELADYACNDAEREWELFTILLPKLSNPGTELRVMQHTLELFFHPMLEVDEAKGHDLIEQMDAEIDKAVAEAGIDREIVGKDAFEVVVEQAITDAGDDPEQYRKPAKNTRGYKLAIAKDDPERELLDDHPDDQVRNLMAASNAVSSWPLHTKRIQRIVRQAKAAGGKLPVPLKYHGAHTGRWSGGEKINLQNLGSRGHELVNAVREMLVAPDRHELVIADASQIEARVLAWIAGQWDLCEKFENGRDIYCEFASKVLGRKVRKPRDTGIPAVEDRHKWARNSVGKVGILGCGYGLGASKMDGQFGVNDFALSQKIVETYRQEHDKIKQFWHDVEAAFKYTMKYGQPCEMPRGLRFEQTDDCDVIITLPNGRELKYHKVRLKPGKYGDELSVWNDQTKSWVHIWGGYLTENIVQAISRDILWGAMDWMEHDGCPIALHVHDELIGVVVKGEGEHFLELATKYLSTRPDWAPDCPLAAEGLITERYGGH